jgi:hypothetical protein
LQQKFRERVKRKLHKSSSHSKSKKREKTPQQEPPVPQQSRPPTPQKVIPPTPTPQKITPPTPQPRPPTPQQQRPPTPQQNRPTTPQKNRPSTPQKGRPSNPAEENKNLFKTEPVENKSSKSEDVVLSVVTHTEAGSDEQEKKAPKKNRKLMSKIGNFFNHEKTPSSVRILPHDRNEFDFDLLIRVLKVEAQMVMRDLAVILLQKMRGKSLIK